MCWLSEVPKDDVSEQEHEDYLIGLDDATSALAPTRTEPRRRGLRREIMIGRSIACKRISEEPD